MKQTIFHLHTISSLHVGIGQGTGVIDLPIARERASNLPQIPGSSIKGVLRDELNPESQEGDKKLDKDDYLALFGSEASDNDSEHAGSIAVGDARLLALPIRSWRGTFAWATCPMILHRYQRDLNSNNMDIDGIPSSTPTITDEKQAIHADETVLKADNSNKIFLEDLDLTTNKGAEDWGEFIANQIFTDDDWKTQFKQRFLILSDNVFDFLSETATEIRARIRIEPDTRTVQQGALWYEEYLPAETLLWGIIATDRSRKPEHDKDAKIMLELIPNNKRLQIGGNATTGSGQVRWIKGEQ